MPPDPPNRRFQFAQLQISIQVVFYRGVQLTYFEKKPAIQNSTPPLKNSGHGPAGSAIIIILFVRLLNSLHTRIPLPLLNRS